MLVHLASHPGSLALLVYFRYLHFQRIRTR
jgi:hypothetical protein